MSIPADGGTCIPFEYADRAYKPYLPSGEAEDPNVRVALGSGDWAAGMLKQDIFEFWQSVKSMYYTFTVTISTEDIHTTQFATTTSGGMASLTASGVTRRYLAGPNRSPGYHTTFRGVRGAGGSAPLISANSVSDFRIDLSKTVYGYKNNRPTGLFWFPEIKVAAQLRAGSHGLTLSSGGTDGFLDIRGPSGAAWAMPVFPMIGLSATLTSGSVQVGSPMIDATVKVMERYDMITFTPLFGPAGTRVTIVQPPVSESFLAADIREGFKHVKEVWFGDTKITTFNPILDITGQNKDIITVVIPTGCGSARFNFIAKYDNLPGKDDYYYTGDDFRVRAS